MLLPGALRGRGGGAAGRARGHRQVAHILRTAFAEGRPRGVGGDAMRCEHLHDSAVYVLGALSPPEREAYERHLADCAQCRAEVAEFSDLPGLLGRLDPEITAQIAMASDDDFPDADGPPFLADAGLSRAGGAHSERDPAVPGQRWAGPTVTPGDGPALSPAGSRWAGPNAVPVNGSAVDPLLPRVLD